jgi:RES domain
MAKSAVGLPPPPKGLEATLVTWGGGLEFHRVHDLAFGGSEFNPSTKGNARFSPITDDAGALIPTLYAGTTLDCALMETIFHDVPFKAGFKPFSKLKMDGKVHSVLLPTADLRLVDLSTVALHKLGVKRTQLIDTTKAHYPATRRWAQAIYTQFPAAQGLRWTSRQDDQAHAVMLFGTRVSPSVVGWHGVSESLLQDGHASTSVIDLAARIGVTLVH